MYNNAIIQTSYKPYVPLPKKKVVKEAEEQQQQAFKGRVVQPNDYSGSNQQQKPAADSFAKNAVPPAKININQLLIDFNSTLNAIGASEEVEQEVKTYLGLVENQSKKETPNKKMIISNLKIAADVLDTYISETLNKPSKVVKDWIDALLLQNIDFKADPKITKGAFESITGEPPQTAKLAEKKLAEKAQTNQQEEIVETLQQEEPKTEELTQQNVQNPTADKIKELVEQGDTFIVSSPQKAMDYFSQAFTLAQNCQDKLAMADIYSKIAQAQNNANNLSQALDCLHASTVLAYSIGNEQLKTQNHKEMGKIYDEAGYMDNALDHYFASIAIDGELDDTSNQADTLNNIGKMYTDRYIKLSAVDYYKDALELAKVTKNTELMGNIFKNTAVTFKNHGDNEKALNNYKNAALLSSKAENKENLAEIYEEAGDLMLQMKHQKRAADLYKKSYRLSEKLQDTEGLLRLRKKLQVL